MTALEHAHEWGPYRVVDFCHYVVYEKECRDCGAVNEGRRLRDLDADPHELMFADPDCEGCRLMLDGNEPPSWRARDAAR